MYHINSSEMLKIQVVTLPQGSFFSLDDAIRKSQIFRLEVEIGVPGEF